MNELIIVKIYSSSLQMLLSKCFKHEVLLQTHTVMYLYAVQYVC